MIIGLAAKEKDIDVHPCREKHLTNIRAVGSEEAIRLSPIRDFGIEEAINSIQGDELVEFTPKSIRFRKKILKHLKKKIKW